MHPYRGMRPKSIAIFLGLLEEVHRNVGVTWKICEGVERGLGFRRDVHQ